MAGFGLWTIGVLGQLFRAFVLTRIWSWYLAPLFGLKPLPFVYAYGLLLFVSAVTPSWGLISDAIAWDKKTANERGAYAIASGVIMPVMSLLFAWIGTFFL